MLKNKYLFLPLLIILTLGISSNAWSINFWKTGTIVRTLTDSTKYGGCMIQLSVGVGNGCPSNGWVSLDCDAIFSDPGEGQRAYATALVALTLDKKISVHINNEQKHNDYCVATRLDIRS